MSMNYKISPLDKFVNKPQWHYFGMPNQIFKEDFYSGRFYVKLAVDTDFYRSVLYAFCTYRKFIKFDVLHDSKQDGKLPEIKVIFDPLQIRDQFFRQAFNDFELEKNYNVKTNAKRLREFINEYFFEFVNDLASISQKNGFNLFPHIYPPALVQSRYNIMTISKLLIVGYNKILQNHGELHPLAAGLTRFLFDGAKRPPEELLKIVCNNLSSVCGIPQDKLLFQVKQKIGQQKKDFIREMVYLTANSRGLRSGPKFSNYNPAINNDDGYLYGNTVPNYKIIASSECNIDDRFRKYKTFLNEWMRSNEFNYLPEIPSTLSANVSNPCSCSNMLVSANDSESISQVNLLHCTDFIETRDNCDYINEKGRNSEMKLKALFAKMLKNPEKVSLDSLKASFEEKSNETPIKVEGEKLNKGLSKNPFKLEILPTSQVDFYSCNNLDSTNIIRRGKPIIKVKEFAKILNDSEKVSLESLETPLFRESNNLPIQVEVEEQKEILDKSVKLEILPTYNNSSNCNKTRSPQILFGSPNFNNLEMIHDHHNNVANQIKENSQENCGLITLNLQTMELSECDLLQNNNILRKSEIECRKRPLQVNSIDGQEVVDKENKSNFLNQQIEIQIDQEIDDKSSLGIFMPAFENSEISNYTRDETNNEIEEPDMKKQKLPDYLIETPTSNMEPKLYCPKFEPDNQITAMEQLVCSGVERKSANNNLQTENFVKNSLVLNVSFLNNFATQEPSIKIVKKKTDKGSCKSKRQKMCDVEDTLLYPVILPELTKFMNTEFYKKFVTNKKGIGPFGSLDKKLFLTFLNDHFFLCEIKNPLLYKILCHCKFLGRTKIKSYEKFVVDLSKNLSSELEKIFPKLSEKSLRLGLYQNLRNKFG